MKEYQKPEIEKVMFATEVITTAGDKYVGDTGEDF